MAGALRYWKFPAYTTNIFQFSVSESSKIRTSLLWVGSIVCSISCNNSLYQVLNSNRDQTYLHVLVSRSLPTRDRNENFYCWDRADHSWGCRLLNTASPTEKVAENLIQLLSIVFDGVLQCIQQLLKWDIINIANRYETMKDLLIFLTWNQGLFKALWRLPFCKKRFWLYRSLWTLINEQRKNSWAFNFCISSKSTIDTVPFHWCTNGATQAFQGAH